jgi:uncharacterized protein (DUF302 family)
MNDHDPSSPTASTDSPEGNADSDSDSGSGFDFDSDSDGDRDGSAAASTGTSPATGSGRRAFLAASAALGAGALASPAAAGPGGGEGDGGTAGGGDAASDAPALGDLGLVTVEREASFETVLDGITAAIEEADALTLVTTFDHAANAASAGLDLPPTTLVLFGNPRVGTPLMEGGRTAGIDLPQKLLVWCEEGRVRVTYNDPAYLAERHGIGGMDERLSAIAGLLERLATAGG